MSQTKMIARIVADQKRQTARAAAVANKPGQSNQRKRRQSGQRIGVKSIEGRNRGRSFKIKRLLGQQRNIDVKKKNGLVVRKMVVCRRTISPVEVKKPY